MGTRNKVKPTNNNIQGEEKQVKDKNVINKIIGENLKY